MSRRTIANAERVLVEITRGGSKAGTVLMAVRVPQYKDGVGNGTQYVIAEQCDDPNKPKYKLQVCASHRLARARREIKYMHGVTLYKHQNGKFVAV